MKLIFSIFAVGILLIYALLEFSPDPVQPVNWEPPPKPSSSVGEFASNNELKDIQKIALGQEKLRTGPMFIDVDGGGSIYTGYANGDVVKMNLDGGNPAVIANTGGRPLAVRVLRDGGLIIADAAMGLIRVSASGITGPVFKSGLPKQLKLITDVLVSPDESFIYFTEASSKFDLSEWIIGVLEHGARGTVYVYDTRRDELKVLAEGFTYSVGLAFGPNQDYLLVTESNSYRIWKVWLRGEKRGQKEIFIDGLPGFPYYISYNGRNCFWVSIAYPRQKWIDWLSRKKFFTTLITAIPAEIFPKFDTQSFVVGFDLSGNTIYNLQYSGEGQFAPITSVKQYQRGLFFGSNEQAAIGRMELLLK
jgi:sugar lactone lactonase YvrE